MEVITNEAGQIKLNDTLLPGIFESMEVSGKLRFDEKSVPGSSGKRKQPLGYEDAGITLNVKLLTDEESDCYEKLDKLTSLFHNIDNKAKPYVYRIVNRHLTKWNIREILFSELRTSEDNREDTIKAALGFVEYKPALVAAEAKAAAPPSKSSVSLPSKAAATAIDISALPLAGGFMAQEAPSMGDFKQNEYGSPAIDDDTGADIPEIDDSLIWGD